MHLLLIAACGSPATDSGPPTGTTATGTTATSTVTVPTTLPEPGAVVLVVPDTARLHMLSTTGERLAALDYAALSSLCTGDVTCDGQGASVDPEDGSLWMSVRWRDGQATPGAVLHLRPQGDAFVAEGTVSGFAFPHDVERDPTTGLLIVADTFRNQVSWVPPDGDGTGPLHVLDGTHAQHGDWFLPNGLQLLVEDGGPYLLVTYRSDVLTGPDEAGGTVALWQVADPASPVLVWSFPADGHLGNPHGAGLFHVQGRWLLLYAHSTGLDLDGSVGVAVADALTDPPAYLADLRAPDGTTPLGFPRGVWTDGATLWVTDTLSLGDNDGAATVRAAPLPAADAAPSGLSGAYTTDFTTQLVQPLEGLQELTTGLEVPFEGWTWTVPPGPE